MLTFKEFTELDEGKKTAAIALAATLAGHPAKAQDAWNTTAISHDAAKLNYAAYKHSIRKSLGDVDRENQIAREKERIPSGLTLKTITKYWGDKQKNSQKKTANPLIGRMDGLSIMKRLQSKNVEDRRGVKFDYQPDLEDKKPFKGA